MDGNVSQLAHFRCVRASSQIAAAVQFTQRRDEGSSRVFWWSGRIPFMQTSLCVLPLRRRRDVLLARQRARQVASLLGIDAREQTLLAAAVFEMGNHAVHQFGKAEIRFLLDGDHLQISTAAVGSTAMWRTLWAEQDSLVCIRRELPPASLSVDREDLPWLLEELAKVTPAKLFDEVQQQNQELLRTLHELQACHDELARLHHRQRSAA
jgi:hypothetical protein